jgi:hypothetical protein
MEKHEEQYTAASGFVTHVPKQDERAECCEGGVEVREGNRWSSRKHRLYKSRYCQAVSITIAPAIVLYANSNDLCTHMRFAHASRTSCRVKFADAPLFQPISGHRAECVDGMCA